MSQFWRMWNESMPPLDPWASGQQHYCTQEPLGDPTLNTESQAGRQWNLFRLWYDPGRQLNPQPTSLRPTLGLQALWHWQVNGGDQTKLAWALLRAVWRENSLIQSLVKFVKRCRNKEKWGQLAADTPIPSSISLTKCKARRYLARNSS